MANNSINMTKANNHLSSQTIECKKKIHHISIVPRQWLVIDITNILKYWITLISFLFNKSVKMARQESELFFINSDLYCYKWLV